VDLLTPEGVLEHPSERCRRRNPAKYQSVPYRATVPWDFTPDPGFSVDPNTYGIAISNPGSSSVQAVFRFRTSISSSDPDAVTGAAYELVWNRPWDQPHGACSDYTYLPDPLTVQGCVPWADGQVHTLLNIQWEDGFVDTLQFQSDVTTVDTAAVPEPTTVSLLAVGLGTLLSIRIRQRTVRQLRSE
jgi:hypothetical protein